MFLDLMFKLYIQALQLFRRKDGASAVEYVIILTIVAVVIVTFGGEIGTKITGVLQSVSDGLPAGTGS